jgi:AraC-like DNA-binding protein
VRQATLFRSPALGVIDIRCRSPRSGPSAERGGEPVHLALVRRGAFAYHLGTRAFVADPNTALLHAGPASYRISHPGSAGDDVTVFELAPELAAELFGRAPCVGWATPPALQLRHQRVLAALGSGPADLLGGEERVLGLLALLGRGGRPGVPPLRRGDRRLVETVKARLSADLARNVPLTAVAAEAGASPFHVMRAFRAATGLTVRAYRRQLRVLAALAEVTAGGRDLAGLALRLGFSHHGHLTDSFRRLLGVPPSRLRGAERAGPGPSTFVEARGRPRA